MTRKGKESRSAIDRECSVCVFAPTGRDCEVISNVLASGGVSCVPCGSIQELTDWISSNLGPVILAEEAIAPGEIDELTEVLEVQPDWSSLPIVLMMAPGREPRRSTELRSRPDCFLLRRPTRKQVFLTLVNSMLSMRSRPYVIRNLLESLYSSNLQLKSRTERLSRLAHELTQSEERERRRIADILHDDLQQLLVAVKLSVQGLDKQVAAGAELLPKTRRALQLVTAAIDSSRSLSHRVYPGVLYQEDLLNAMQWLAGEMAEKYNLKVRLDVDPGIHMPDEVIRGFLYRTASELLFNVVKHSGTREADLVLHVREGKLFLGVSDHGKGFAPGTLEENRKDTGFGLLTIEERASALGGKFEVKSEPGRGSRASVVLPVFAGPGVVEQGERSGVSPGVTS